MRRRKALHKSLKLYLSKLKQAVPSHLHLPNNASSAAATRRLLSSCKYPKTPSLEHNNNITHQAATLSDVDRFLYENFHSLYISERRNDDDGSIASHLCDGDTSNINRDELRRRDVTIRSSERFFVSPVTSNSLLDEARPSAGSSSSSSSSSSCSSESVAGAGVSVTTFSKDPYDDFFRSMKDMVDARHVEPSQSLDWDFMEDLLFCYLELNDRSVHKYILNAFSELTVSLQQRRQGPERSLPSLAMSTRRRYNLSTAGGHVSGLLVQKKC